MVKEVYLSNRGFVGQYDWAVERAIRVKIALETGWTFEYIDSMGLVDYEDLMAYWAGQGKARDAEA